MRVTFKISYNGTHFLGSQVQKETSNTIMGQIQKSLHKLGINTPLVASGRTDKGVHALGQVCHVDIPSFWTNLSKLQNSLNKMLPQSIYIKKIMQVDTDFHARYSAKRRVYRYIFKEGVSNPFENDFVTFVEHINYDLLQKKITLFKGAHDFKYFMKTGSDVKSTQRVLYNAFAYKYKGYIILNFQANGFLRAQIRLMVGALLTLNENQLQEKLSCLKNHKTKPAPSNGLYLSCIHY